MTTYGMDVLQFADYVVQPANMRLSLNTLAADRLVLGTALTESGLFYIDQLDPGDDDPGPAYGLFQMEQATHDDIWTNYLRYKPELAEKVLPMAARSPFGERQMPHVTELRWNLLYAAAMCRVHYRRARPALPDADDAYALAAYWKAHYNTPAGKGTVAKAIPHFQRAIELIG